MKREKKEKKNMEPQMADEQTIWSVCSQVQFYITAVLVQATVVATTCKTLYPDILKQAHYSL